MYYCYLILITYFVFGSSQNAGKETILSSQCFFPRIPPPVFKFIHFSEFLLLVPIFSLTSFSYSFVHHVYSSLQIPTALWNFVLDFPPFTLYLSHFSIPCKNHNRRKKNPDFERILDLPNTFRKSCPHITLVLSFNSYLHISLHGAKNIVIL